MVPCSVCKEEKPCPWSCLLCAASGLTVAVCSPVCRHRHGRDGRHRRLLRTGASPTKPAKPADDAPEIWARRPDA
jgi:hypothetical protein